MVLNKTQKYAVKIIFYLARQNYEMCSATKIHQELNIPYKYLTRLLTRLSKDNILSVHKGRDGGFVLQKKLNEIFLSEIIECVSDEDVGFNTCILNDEVCNRESPCTLHQKWSDIRRDINTFFQKTSLEDLQEEGIFH